MRDSTRWIARAGLWMTLVGVALWGIHELGFISILFLLAGLLLGLGWIYSGTSFPSVFLSHSQSRGASSPSRRTVSPEGAKELNISGHPFDEMLRLLGSQESMLNIILNSMSEGVLLLNQSDRIVLMNPSAEKIWGLAQKKGLGKHYLEIVRHPILANLLLESKKNGISSGEIELTGKEERTHAVSVSAIQENPGRILGQIVVLSDITDMKKLMRMRTDFVANVSHELKTPLTAILGYVETLLEGALEDKKNRGLFVRKISDQAHRLYALISDVLELSKIESGMLITSLESIDLFEIVTQTIEVLKAKWEAKEIKIRQEIPPGTLVWAHSEGLFHVFENLLDNAIKFSHAKSEIRVFSQKTEDGRVEFLVEDHGFGIPVEVQTRVFERFFRVDASRNRSMGGTGLGLSIVKHLTEKMQGEVALKSEEGKGSTFSIFLQGVPRS